MIWDPESLCDDFSKVAKLSGLHFTCKSLTIEPLLKPHQPKKLQEGCSAVYIFSTDDNILKVGKVGAKSGPRYTSQHYNPKSSMSNLAASILKDKKYSNHQHICEDNVGYWIKQNCDRVNIILSPSQDRFTLNLLEAFIQCRLRPVYEGS